MSSKNKRMSKAEQAAHLAANGKRVGTCETATILDRDGRYILARVGGSYVMSGGRYGEHRLAVSCTSDVRLRAHWLGYCAQDDGHTLADVVRDARS